ncbi:MAG: phospho-sugar mutase [Clostridia bacterium]|nr:phospho-sugar mutase [Clostridia bacterium]
MEFLKTIEGVAADILDSVALSNIKEWKSSLFCDDNEVKEIDSMSDEEKRRAFTTLIKFGTAGLRGKMLAGSSNMNRTTVALATFALGKLVLDDNGQDMGVVIACDSRNNSELYSRLSASILAGMGIKVYIFDALRPTPELSFALRHLGCKAGINVTASHNTREYNGYKVYWEDGAQLPPVEAEKISSLIPSLSIGDIEAPDFDTLVKDGKITVIADEVDREYLKCVLSQTVDRACVDEYGDKLRILYTPLHGAGYKLVPEALRLAGFKSVDTVPSQSIPDGDFPTVEKPNPQFIEAFTEAIALKRECDLIIATDPDADRMGVAVTDKNGKYRALSGNEIALILIEYIIKARSHNGSMPKNPAVVKSLVSSALAEVVCKRNGVEIFNVYTGFKYIGEKIKEFERDGSHSFLFGFEESYGYLAGTYARDKDGVVASMLIAEASCYYKSQGLTLLDALDEIYKTYGFWGEYWSEAVITAPDFKAESARIMQGLREAPKKEIAGERLITVSDWLSQTVKQLDTGECEKLTTAPENMLGYTLESGSRVIMRPSGTEPKIKLYYFINARTPEEAVLRRDEIKNGLGF